MSYLFILAACTLFAQVHTTVYDASGNLVVQPAIQEKRERKVLEDGPNGRVVEETVVRKDSAGNALPPEKVRTVERKNADGSNTVETTRFTGDLNGRLQPVERSTVNTMQQGAATTSTTNLERPSFNGGFDSVEKTTSQSTVVNGKQQTNTSIYRVDGNGRLVEAVRQVAQKVPDGKATKETVTEYQSASTGKLELSQQKVSVQMPNADGSTTSEITIYGMAAPGRPADGKLHLREQQLLETAPGPNNTVRETLSIRRPGVTEEKLGPYQRISEKLVEKPTAETTKP